MCECIPFKCQGEPRFRNGDKVPTKEEVTYLGCKINNKGCPNKEVNKRITYVMITLGKWTSSGDTGMHPSSAKS